MGSKKEVLRDLILGFLNVAKEIQKTKLAKLILFAEIEHFRSTGDTITGLYFVRMTKGPVIAFFDEVLEEGIGKLWDKRTQQILIREEGRMKNQYTYIPMTEISLPPNIQQTVNKVYDKYGHMSGTELSRLSHNLPAWKHSESNEPIFVPELTVEDEDEFFALLDIVEDFDDDDNLAEEISRALSTFEGRI